MRNHRTWGLKGFVWGVAAIAAFALAVRADAPRGWFLAGTKPAEYEVGMDPAEVHEGHGSVYLKNKNGTTEGFGTLMQQIQAGQYLGKRVRLSGYVKAEGVAGWSGLWMRVDKQHEMLEFDNMQDRPIEGTSDWRSYDVVLEVPEDSTGIAFGILLEGPGRVWLSGTKFEVVSDATKTTGSAMAARPAAPVNLDFSE
jgi:hypothetical protein